jgi:hypothetical protein
MQTGHLSLISRLAKSFHSIGSLSVSWTAPPCIAVRIFVDDLMVIMDFRLILSQAFLGSRTVSCNRRLLERAAIAEA